MNNFRNSLLPYKIVVNTNFNDDYILLLSFHFFIAAAIR